MLRFKCKMCGQEILASDKDAGGKTKCPNCFSLQTVPEPFYVKMRAKAQKTPHPLPGRDGVQAAEPDESRQSQDEYIEEDIDEKYSSLINLQFNEASLFVMSFAFLALFAIDQNVHQNMHAFLLRLCGGGNWVALLGIIFLLLPFSLGLVLSVFHAFSIRQKSFFDKALMLFFAVGITAGTGICMEWYILSTAKNLWLTIFALCNLFYSGLLIFKFEGIVIENDLDGNYISDRNAAIGQILFGMATALVLLLVCRFWLKFHWVVTYSICITYITALDKTVQSIIRYIRR